MDMKAKSVYKPGDRVIIRNLGQEYTTYSDWFEENGISARIAARYQYNYDIGSHGVHEGDVVTVIAVGAHKSKPNEVLLAVEDDHPSHRVWLIGARGVEPEIKTYNVLISFPKRFRAKSFAEANDIAREYLSNATGIAVDDIEVHEE